MSLKAMHIFFITISTLLAIGFGMWSLHDYHEHAGGTAALLLAVASFVAAVALVVYGVWFLRKLKGVSLL